MQWVANKAQSAPAVHLWQRESVRWGLLVAVWLLALAWIRPLSDPDEGRYAVVALDMLRSGDWVTPHLNGLPFFHKPPLYYWLAASGFAVFGVHEWVARLPSMLGAWMAAMSLFLLVRRYVGAADGKAAALVFVTAPLVYLAAQYANMDMLLAGCVTACTVCAWVATVEAGRDRPWRMWMACAGVCAGLGFLAKGLIGIVLPGMVWCIWLIWERRWRQWWLPLYPPVWLGLWMVAAPWALLAQHRFPQFFHYFFVTQHFQRYTETGFNNPQAWWFYLAVIALAGLPWTAAGLLAALKIWRSNKGTVPAVFGAQHRWAQSAMHSLDRYMLVWFAVVVGFFSVPHSKIVGYILPALPALAYGIARVLRGVAWAPTASSLWFRNRFTWVASFAAGLCIVAAIALGTIAVPEKVRWQQLASVPVEPNDQVMMLGHLYYEVPFYLSTQSAAWVVDDWKGLPSAKSDNWHKELSDAAEFAPQKASDLLLNPAEARQRLCSTHSTVWIVGELAAAQQWVPSLVQRAPFLRVGPHSVWKWQAADAGC